MFGRAILGVLCAIGLGTQASAAALLEETLRDGHVVLHLTGRIDSRDVLLFDAAVGKLTGAGKRIDVVSLNSPGGQLGEALRLATRVEDGAVPRSNRVFRSSRAVQVKCRRILAWVLLG
jgi:hypothetical protein